MNEVVAVPPAQNEAAPAAQAPAPAAVTQAAVAHCKNCGAVLLGRFCSNCSQAADVHVPSTRELLHDMLEGLTHSDSRLWLTLKYLWFSPGKLTQEFIAGRRVAYLPPFRLYLVLSIIFFLLVSVTTTRVEVVHFDEALKPAAVPQAAQAPAAPRLTNCGDIDPFSDHPEWNKRLQHACLESVRDNGNNLFHAAFATMSKAMFIFLPLIAFLHMLLYWRPRHRYAEHLLFFVHLHAFYFSVAILLVAATSAADVWPKLIGASGIVQKLLGWSLPVYTVVAMRRVFRRTWMHTLFNGAALFLTYAVVFGMTVAGVFVYAALQL
jgi:Protein of unknown function (DUF3667)